MELTADQKFEVALAEYQAAQASAEHHDQLVWTVTSILWGASLVLLGFVLDAMTGTPSPPIALFYFLAGLGILITIAVTIYTFSLRYIKVKKYKRCRELEVLLGAEQHTKLDYPRLLQTVVHVFVNVGFIVAWVVVICNAPSN